MSRKQQTSRRLQKTTYTYIESVLKGILAWVSTLAIIGVIVMLVNSLRSL